MGPDLWEIRVKLPQNIARLLFTVQARQLVLLHGFIKKTKKNATVRAKAGPATPRKPAVVKKATAAAKGRIGSSPNDFLQQEGLLQEVVAAATKRVIAWQLDQAMKQQKMAKTALAERMGTSRAALSRLLDETDTGMTLSSLTSAAAALGKSVRMSWWRGSFQRCVDLFAATLLRVDVAPVLRRLEVPKAFSMGGQECGSRTKTLWELNGMIIETL